MTAGQGELECTRIGDRTHVTRARSASPLKLLTPRPGGRAAWVYQSSYGGGLVSGDHVQLDVIASVGATVLLSTQAATKIYRSHVTTQQSLCVRVADDALVVNVPDPLCCFSGAHYAQDVAYHLSAGASLVALDWLSAGRYNERWQFAHYQSRARLVMAGDTLLDERVLLDPTHGAIAARMGRFGVVGCLLVVGEQVRHVSDRLASTLSCPAGPRPPKRPDVSAGLSALGSHGAVIRFAAISIDTAQRWLRGALADVVPLLGDDPWARKH